MTSPRNRAAAVVLLTAAVTASGCSSDGSPQAQSSSRPTATPSSTASTGTGGQEVSRCRVKGFVPTTRIEVTSIRREPLYASLLSLDPGIALHRPRLQLFRRDVRPGAVVVSPRGVALDPGVARQTEGVVDGTSAAPLPAERRAHRTVRNRTGRSVDLALYLDAKVVRDRWTTKDCGGLINDGTSVAVVHGRTTTVGPLAFHAVDCRTSGGMPHRVRVEACGQG